MGVGSQRLLLWPTALLVFGFSWVVRFNDPNGAFAGLTDDHFFYLARGWQILFGDVPVRDFVDHGAPLYYYVAAAVQALFGRGTLSELLFSVTVLACGATLTFWLAARASGSVVLGLLGAGFQVLLDPRFYNYPKILAYATAIPLLWSFAERPSARNRFGVAVATAIWFLFRHDHGVFIAGAMVATLALSSDMPWSQRFRHVAIYGALVVVLLAPYLVFIERSGGVYTYFRQASEWAARDRERAPVEWPGLVDYPSGVSDDARSGAAVERVVAIARDNIVAWTFYAELLIPLFALFVLAASKDGFRPGWPRARIKLATVVVLGVVLDAGFLRSPLEARLADPSVPLAILIAWLARAVPLMILSRRSLQPAVARRPWPARGGVAMVGTMLAFVLAIGMTNGFVRRLEKTALKGEEGPIEKARRTARQLRAEWHLESWMARANRKELVSLALYVNACTMPADRVLVQAYMPQVLALARRAFAGGHADLRPGFFGTEEAQRLTVARLQRQSVPLILLEADDEYRGFRRSFPLVTAYIDERYRLAETGVFDGFGVTLFVRRDAIPRGVWGPLGWPCYGIGRLSAS